MLSIHLKIVHQPAEAPKWFGLHYFCSQYCCWLNAADLGEQDLSASGSLFGISEDMVPISPAT